MKKEQLQYMVTDLEYRNTQLIQRIEELEGQVREEREKSATKTSDIKMLIERIAQLTTDSTLTKLRSVKIKALTSLDDKDN